MKSPYIIRPGRQPIWLMCPLLAVGVALHGADAPTSIPSRIDFNRDIRPIFEVSCLRCHGPEKPRSHFRLDDSDAALQGGKGGVDILPGRSGESPLIARVSSDNDDVVMPPPGKGERLTAAQVALLRAWIDQGAIWGSTNSGARATLALETEFGGISVHGDRGKFREVEGINDGFSGGVKQLSFAEQISATEKFSAEGRFLSGGQEDTLRLDWTKNDFGFVRAGFEQWRQYSDNFGGFDPAVKPAGATPGGGLSLTEGRAWVDFGLTPARGPQITLGYEQQYRQGSDSTLDWGLLGGKNIAPSTEDINERTHIFKLDVSADIAGWQLDDNARVEIHRQQDQDNEVTGSKTVFQTRDHYDSTQGMNTLRVERTVCEGWSVSAGYCYSRLEASDELIQTGAPPSIQYWEAPSVTLSSASHIFSVSSLFQAGPFLSLGLDSQNEWTHEEGFGDVENNFGLVAVPILIAPVTENANYDEFKSMQNATLRFTKIPWTVVFADARFEQDTLSEFQQGNIDGPTSPFARQTDADNTEHDVRAGFTASPRTWGSFNLQARTFSSATTYNNLIDSTPLSGYPAFILGRNIDTDEAEAKLTLRPVGWLRAALNYKIERTDFSTRTDPVSFGISPGGPLLSGRYQAHTYGLSAAAAPLARLNLTGTLSYSDSRTTTFANGDAAVVPYKGGVYVATAGASYALGRAADLSASYSFAHADYAENNGAVGVPLGLNYTRHSATVALSGHLSASVTAALRYVFYTYAEPSSGGLTDYTAQGFFATLSYRWP